MSLGSRGGNFRRGFSAIELTGSMARAQRQPRPAAGMGDVTTAQPAAGLPAYNLQDLLNTLQASPQVQTATNALIDQLYAQPGVQDYLAQKAIQAAWEKYKVQIVLGGLGLTAWTIWLIVATINHHRKK